MLPDFKPSSGQVGTRSAALASRRGDSGSAGRAEAVIEAGVAAERWMRSLRLGDGRGRGAERLRPAAALSSRWMTGNRPGARHSACRAPRWTDGSLLLG
jgi:hypothetical protein